MMHCNALMTRSMSPAASSRHTADDYSMPTVFFDNVIFPQSARPPGLLLLPWLLCLPDCRTAAASSMCRTGPTITPSCTPSQC